MVKLMHANKLRSLYTPIVKDNFIDVDETVKIDGLIEEINLKLEECAKNNYHELYLNSFHRIPYAVYHEIVELMEASGYDWNFLYNSPNGPEFDVVITW